MNHYKSQQIKKINSKLHVTDIYVITDSVQNDLKQNKITNQDNNYLIITKVDWTFSITEVPNSYQMGVYQILCCLIVLEDQTNIYHKNQEIILFEEFPIWLA